MGAESEAESESLEPKGAEGPGTGAVPPSGDSAGVYYLSVEDFESRLPRSNPPGAGEEAPPARAPFPGNDSEAP